MSYAPNFLKFSLVGSFAVQNNLLKGFSQSQVFLLFIPDASSLTSKIQKK